MSKTEVFSTQVADHHGALPQWEHTLVSVGERLSPLLPERTIAQVLPMVTPEFKGALECGALGETVLFKITATPFFFRSSPRGEKSGALPLLLCSQLSGETHVKQQNWAATLRSQDWCLLDTRFLHEARWVAPRNEMLILGLDPPSGREGRGLLERALGHRWNGQTGISRVLQATLKETFRQLDRLDVSNGRAITRAISVMTWDALREQLEAPHGLKPQDRRQSQVKEYIECCTSPTRNCRTKPSRTPVLSRSVVCNEVLPPTLRARPPTTSGPGG